MATNNLLSSPSRRTLHDPMMALSSSPDFPDLQDLIVKKPKPTTLRSGSSADLLRVAQVNGPNPRDLIPEPEPPAEEKAPAKRARKAPNMPKRAAREVIVLSSDGATPKGARQDEPVITEAGKQSKEMGGGKETQGTPMKGKPRKKLKAPLDLAHAESEASEAKSTKPAKAKTLKKRSKPETVSRHFAKEPVIPEKPAKATTPEPLNLELAMQRRTDWTPPRPDTMHLFSEPDAFDVEAEITQPEGANDSLDTSHVFKNLSDMYGRKLNETDASAPKKVQTTNVLGKRKVIEMVSANQPSKPTEQNREPSPVKAKAPKKKPRTITELATAAYAPKAAEPVEEYRREDSLLEYFSVGGEEQDAIKYSAPKGKGKAAKVTKAKKKALPKRPLLLSPQAAMRISAKQDFVFGTSSQLAREQSPTFLKDLHSALRASNKEDDEDPFATSPRATESKKTEKGGRGLWSVSARDEDGELANIDIIDMVDDSPGFPMYDAILDPLKDLPLELTAAETETADSSVIEIESRPAPGSEDKPSQRPIPKSQVFMTQRKMTVNTAAAVSPPPSRPSFPVITGLLEEEAPPPSNQEQSQEEIRPESTTANTVQEPRPEYELFTDARLAKEVSSFGFKAVKTRSAMIALLDQCWRSKNQTQVAGASFLTSAAAASPKGKKKTTSLAVSAASTSPVAKRPRGRPKKATDAEAPASPKSAKIAQEGAASPTKKRGRPRKEAIAASKTTASSIPPAPKPQPTVSTPKRKKAAAQPTTEIVDFDIESDTSADMSSPEQVFSSPTAGGVDVSITDDTEMTLTLSPTTQQSALFSRITKAVTCAPRTTDPANPSWHEKMLMYDPIILEDLTTWLNSGQLTKVGHDDEVSPEEVKNWCESKSICCLWKVNVHGKERKRF